MQKLSLKFEIFEGPLDLLLHLIEKNKIEIFDIPIAEILDQYLEYVNYYKIYNADSISDFISMASTLMLIKSRMLLPKTEEEEDPRAELVDMLVEYRKYKKAAQWLAERSDKINSLFVRPRAEVEFDRSFSGNVDINELLQAYNRALRRVKYKLPPPPETFSAIVSTKIVSVASKVTMLIGNLIACGKVKFSSIFMGAKSRSDIVATFLAVLELTKDNRILIGDVKDDDVDITLNEKEVAKTNG